MKTIAIMNNKGGVGKTVTAINLADILVRDYHKRVVLADCDGQLYDLDLLAIRDGLGVPHALMRFCKAAAQDYRRWVREYLGGEL